MNIMAFSFDWFLTVPGMLITGGVLLLLIALIMFIVTSVKSKKGSKEEAEVAPATPETTAPVAEQPVTPDTVAPQMGAAMISEPTAQPVRAASCCANRDASTCSSRNSYSERSSSCS